MLGCMHQPSPLICYEIKFIFIPTIAMLMFDLYSSILFG